jgi:cytochrome c-type biogenesis protein CcmH
VFWTIAGAVLFMAAIITVFPLLRGKSYWQPLALALAFGLPAAGLWMYNHTGTPAAIGIEPVPQAAQADGPHSSGSEEMTVMIEGLRSRLEQDPGDLDGWMLLARTLRATQQFQQASDALEEANRLAPGNPFVMVELAESWIFLTADGRIPQRSVDMLESALEIDPDFQKALWLMGIAASQQGDYAFAISYWQTLMSQLEPGSDVAQTVQRQMDDAMVALGMQESMPEMAAAEPESASVPEAAPEATAQKPETIEPESTEADSPSGPWAGTRVTISASDAAMAAIPPNAVLYLMVRSAGMAMGPPLGVQRIQNPVFPLELTVTDANSMMQDRLISSEEEIMIQARISLSGSPAARSGDWQSNRQSVSLSSNPDVELTIDQQVE